MDLEQYIQEMERKHLQDALVLAGGVRTKAAALVKMSYRPFKHYAKKYVV